jgi:hypothetical protein
VAKQTGDSLRTGAATAPFRDHLMRIRAQTPGPASWTTVEADFLAAMEAFDAAVIAGTATDGQRQNGKGDYFNDLLAVVLENAAGVELNARRGVPGLIFPNHNLDVTYPATTRGDVHTIAEVMVEAKMMGTPQHQGNETTEQPEGRRGSADLLKRCKEAGFKSIDLKAAFGMLQSQAGEEQQAGPGGDLTTWLRSVRPKSYMVLGVRVTSDSDAQAVRTMADNMTRVMDGVGLFLYRAKGYKAANLSPPRYEAVPVSPTLELVRVLQRITNDLRAAKARGTTTAPAPPSVAVETAVAQAAEDETADMERAEVKAQVDELMRRYADGEIDGEAYKRRMIKLTTSARSDD